MRLGRIVFVSFLGQQTAGGVVVVGVDDFRGFGQVGAGQAPYLVKIGVPWGICRDAEVYSRKRKKENDCKLG